MRITDNRVTHFFTDPFTKSIPAEQKETLAGKVNRVAGGVFTTSVFPLAIAIVASPYIPLSIVFGVSPVASIAISALLALTASVTAVALALKIATYHSAERAQKKEGLTD